MMKCFAWACLLGSLCATMPVRSAHGYIAMGRWSATAQNPSTGTVGSAVNLTWSIVPDGTWIPSKLAPSNLVARLDEQWGTGPGGSDLTQRPWFGLFQQSMDRWSELGGVTFSYEPTDDGLIWGTLPGVSGVRADIRISGASMDGPLGKLAHNELPSNGDMLIDTDDMSYFGRSSQDHLRFRNVLMHEVGHGLGLGHVVSEGSNFLMRPSNTTSFDGPQFDDLLGFHHLYGDRFEKANGGAGNGRREHAVPLGTLAPGSMIAIGSDATSSTVITADQTDFVSISNQYDTDYFSFRLTGSGKTTIALAPAGGSYDVGRQGSTPGDWDALCLNDLDLTLFDASGTQLATANLAPAGETELLANLPLLGGVDYFVRVSGTGHMAQFYSLQIGMSHEDSASTLIVGDFNSDGSVDMADYTVWRNSLGQVGMGLAADADGDMVVDQRDYAFWKQNFGTTIYQMAPDLTGDFNNDGAVDAADFTVWRNSLGTTGFGLPADANRDGVVDQKDYEFWKADFGAGSPAALAGIAAAAAVPEPQSLLLLATLALVAAGYGRARRRQSPCRSSGAPPRS